MTPTVHRWIAREDWAAAGPITSAQVVVGVDPGACGAAVALVRDGSEVLAWTTWDGAAEHRRVIGNEMPRWPFLGAGPVVLVEEPVPGPSRLATIQQGWDAGWVGALVADRVGARHVVRVHAAVWQAVVLGVVDRGPDGKRLPAGKARKARKAAAVAALPESLAGLCGARGRALGRARTEALADAYGLARWGTLIGGEERAA